MHKIQNDFTLHLHSLQSKQFHVKIAFMKKEILGFSSLFYDNPLSCWIYDLETFNILAVNEAAELFLGYSAPADVLLNINDVIIQEDLQAFVGNHATVNTKKGIIHLGNFSFYTKSGLELCITVSGYKITYESKACFLAIFNEYKVPENIQSPFKQLMEAATDVFCSIDKDGKFIHVSAAAKQLWGFSPSELSGKYCIDLAVEEDKSKTTTVLNDVLSKKGLRLFTNRFKKKNGDSVNNSWSAIWDPSAELIYCMVKDESKLKELEAVKYDNVFPFESLVQEGSDIFSIVDKDGFYTYVSPTCTSILGIAAEDIVGKKTTEFIHPEDLEENLRTLEAIYTQKKVIVKPFRFLDNNKEWRWMETVLTNMLDNPAVNGIVANSRDVTQKIKEEQKLKLFENVIANSTDAIVITEAATKDQEGTKIIFVNDAFTRMTGYLSEEVLGKTARILQGPKTGRKELDKLQSAIAGFESCEITTINYNKAGEEFWVNLALSPVANYNGQFTNWVSIQRDVTQQKIQVLEKDLLAQISSNFNIQNNLVAALHGLCKSVSDFGAFDLVEVWSLNQEKNEMNLAAHFTALASDEKFYQHKMVIDKISRNEGIVGIVWDKKEQVLWDNDEMTNEIFLRQVAAKTINLQTVLCIPLFYNDEVTGVLLIGTKNKSHYFKNYVRIFKKLEQFVGSELIRKKRENDLNHLLNAIPEVLCISDFNGKLLNINQWGCELLGYTEEELLFHTLNEFVHPDDRENSFLELDKVVQGTAIYEFVIRFLTKKGKTIWLSWTINPVIEEGIIYAVGKDITSEKKLSHLIKQTNSLAKIGGWEFDFSVNNLYWSDMVHEIAETDATTFVPKINKLNDFIRTDYQDHAQNTVLSCMQTGDSFDIELVILTVDQKEKWVRLIGNADMIEGRCQRIYGSIQDINSLKETEDRLSSISKNLPGVVYQYIVHQNGLNALQYVSGEVEELWGFSKKEVTQNVNLVWDQIKEGGDYIAIKESILKSVTTKTKWSSRFKYIKPNGEVRTHLGYGSPNFLTDGTIIYNSIIVDVTQEAKNEELLEQTTELALIGSWELDLINQQGDQMYWSPMIKRILEVEDNFTPTLSGGLHFYVGDNKEKVIEATTNLIKNGVPFDEEVLIKTKNGSTKWIRIIGKSETVRNRRVKIFGSLQDINDKKLVEQKLQKAFKEKNEILESIGDAFCSFDKNWTVTYWNKEAENVLGRAKELIVGRNLWKEYPDVVGTEFYNQYRKAVQTKKVTSFESYYPTVNKWLEVSAYPSDEGLSVYFKDITLRKEVDLRLLEANERFEKVTEATKDAIWDWDIANNTFYRSKAVENFFGKDTLKLMSTDDFWQDKFHEDDLQNIKKSIQVAINDPQCDRWELEYRIYNDNKVIIYVADQGVIIRNKKGKATRMVGAMTDISEQKNMTIKLNELNHSLQLQSTELKRSNEELEQFAFVASHDLQEPLRMITSFMDLLARKYGNLLDEKGHKYIYYATDGAVRMKQIILDLLYYSRASKPTEGKQLVDLNEIILEFGKLRRKIIAEKKVNVTSENLPKIMTYKAAVTQVFNCIMDNAIKYSVKDKQPEITIKVVDKGDNWQFSISDNGIGIDTQFHDKIFVIFQRLHNADQYPGTGIGLSIAKRHIEFLGGTIWLESKVGEGTVFYFTITKGVVLTN